MRQIIETKKGFTIHYDYSKSITDDIKLMPGRAFNWQDKSWTVPLSSRSFILSFAKKHRFDMGDGKPATPSMKAEEMRLPEMPVLMQDIPLKLQPYPYQRQGIAYGIVHRRFINGDAPGLGKSQPLTAKIATPDGWKFMFEMKVGDTIFGSNGKPQAIEAIFPQGIRPVYRVTMNDGTSTECDEEHLWMVRDRNRKNRGTGWTVKPLSEIIAMGVLEKTSEKRIASGRKPVLKFEIPLAQPVEYTEKQYFIHPYIMGMILGDGSLCGEVACISIPDFEQESVKRISDLLPPDLKLWVNKYACCPQYYFTQTKTTRKNPFMEEIRRLGLNVKGENKFIPVEYLQGSIEQRRQLLCGLMDSDGSIAKGRVTFHSMCFGLVSGVQELVQSLGGQAIVRKYDRGWKGIEWQVNVRVFECPFILERKRIQWSVSKKNYAQRRIQSVEYIGGKECQCIRVSSPDRLYLTDDFIVTHNTCQAIATAIAIGDFPVIVICPSSLKINWEREWAMWSGHKATVLSDSIKNTWYNLFTMGFADVFIVNYESLKKYFVASIDQPIDPKTGKKVPLRINHIKFKSTINLVKHVICDESHRCKESKTLQAKLVKGICSGKENIQLLTGTPVVNKPDDLISQLAIIDRLGDFGGYRNFLTNYCDTDKRHHELQFLLKKNCYFRREKSEVLKDLPAKMRQIVYCDITTRKEYKDAMSDLEDYLKRYKNATDEQVQKSMKGEIMVRIGILKNISARGKIKDAVEYISDVIDSGEKLILFTHLRDVQQTVKSFFPAAVTIFGDDDNATRQANVDKFQKDPKVQLIICSIKAAGVGITLTASSRVAFLELPWHPADCEQCEDRAHRIGQLDSVNCIYLLGKDTIDENIYGIIDDKRAMSNAITGAKNDVELSVQNGLINILSKKL